MVTYQPPDMRDVPIIDAIKLSSVSPDCSAVQAARALGVSFGDDYKEAPFKYSAAAGEQTTGNGSASPKAAKGKSAGKAGRA
jgi:hypothetical protein